MTDHTPLNAERAAVIMTRMQDCHIVVIGDVMLDTFVDGSVDRISPEAPIPVLRHQNTRHMPGGASNVARNLAHLGAQVTLIGITGHDGPREMLIDCLAAEPAITPHLIADPTRPTTTKTRFTAKGHQLLRVDDENINPVSADSMTQMASAILSALDTANMVILSDYDKGVIQPNLITLLTNHPRRADFTILADPKQPDIRIYDGVDILTPNLSEFDYFCQYQNITIPQKRDTGVMNKTHYDVLIVGAGLSGIGAAVHLLKKCPGRSYQILEMRDAMGGTWDLFRYPGIRSDSDMHTLGFNFKPWKAQKAIADGPAIRDYIHETADEYGVNPNIRYGHKVVAASWDSDAGLWTVEVKVDGKRNKQKFTCNWLHMCAGYYNYDQGYTPDFEGRDDFKGDVIHPQQWPEDADLADQQVVVIGSGATAATLLSKRGSGSSEYEAPNVPSAHKALATDCSFRRPQFIVLSAAMRVGDGMA